METIIIETELGVGNDGLTYFGRYMPECEEFVSSVRLKGQSISGIINNAVKHYIKGEEFQVFVNHVGCHSSTKDYDYGRANRIAEHLIKKGALTI